MNTRETINIKDLTNMIDNPRTGKVENEEDEIKSIYEMNPRKLVNLAKAIAENGYENAYTVIIVKDKNKNIVYDGNRRLAALKLLLNTEDYDFLRTSDKKTLIKLRKEHVIPDSIEVVVKGKKQALQYMKLSHGYQGTGSEHENWDSVSKQRFSTLFGEEEPIIILIDEFKSKFNEEITNILPNTTITRILSNSAVKNKLNIDINKRKQYSKKELETIKLVLEKAKNISSDHGQKASRFLNTDKQIKKYLIPELD
ncbi:hypothetical protein ATX60_09620, partial [Oenococcus oeni]|uniref:hypothetical protein n=1 Tax=Oenococcus oeni TaxID=1247 RepID=UPI0008F8E536